MLRLFMVLYTVRTTACLSVSHFVKFIYMPDNIRYAGKSLLKFNKFWRVKMRTEIKPKSETGNSSLVIISSRNHLAVFRFKSGSDRKRALTS